MGTENAPAKPHKIFELYVPTIQGKWWSVPNYHQIHGEKRAGVSHAARIMDTDLGEQLFGDARCKLPTTQ